MVGKAVVVGGSFGGLVAAAALASRVDEVVVVERRVLPDAGTVESVAAQGAVPHVLLGAGAAAVEVLVPGFADEIARNGAVSTDGAAPCHWWAGGAVRREVPDLGIRMPMATRALVESTLRDRVRSLPNVTFLDEGTVRGLRIVGARVRGVELDLAGVRQFLDVDLVVDAGGRSARSADWLAAAGWKAPRTSEVTVRLGYTAVRVRRTWSPEEPLFTIVQNSPALARIGVALQAEDGQLQIVLGGYFGDTAPADRQGMLAFARSLPDPAVEELLENDWITEPIRYQFRSSLRHHWEGIRLPAGFCALGDAVASFNPLYGQGMTSAALQAVELARQLDRHELSPALSRALARAQARIVANPWRIATGADFMYAGTQGRRAPGTNLVNEYLERVFRAAASDPAVAFDLARVQQMLAPPAVLFRPGTLARVRRASRRAAAATVPVAA